MLTFEVIEKNKNKKLYQWDLDRRIKITLPEGIEVDEAHFAHEHDAEALVVKVKNEDGVLVADIPNIHLQSCKPIRVWLVSEDQTIYGDILTVIPRAKPADYVYTETEVLRFENLEARIVALEEDDSGAVHIKGIGNKQFKSVLDTVNRTESIQFETSGSMSYGSWRLLDSPITAYDGTILSYRCDKRYIFRGEIVNHELYSSGAMIHMIVADTEIYAIVDNDPRYSYLYATDIPEKWYSIGTADILHIYNGEGVISNYAHIRGRYNAPTDKVMADIVGNGTDDKNRSNAHTLDWEGNAEFQGDVTAQGCGGETPVSLVATEKRVKKLEEAKPLVLHAEKAEEYTADATVGDETLAAILSGRQILVCTPNADGGIYTKIFSPVYMYQLPNYANEYLYLFYLRDEKQTLDLSALGMGSIQLPIYGELKMKLSKKYNECPLES